LQLKKNGMRLHRSGVSYQLIYGNQILLSGDARGEGREAVMVAFSQQVDAELLTSK
jgi:hypothetical protein